MSPTKNSLAPGASPRLKPVPSSAPSVAPSKVTAEEEQASAPDNDATVVKVVVRVRPTVSRPADGKDLFFVRKTSPSRLPEPLCSNPRPAGELTGQSNKLPMSVLVS